MKLFKYKEKNKKKAILENINEFQTNNIYGLIGVNGAGKTSLLKLFLVNLPTKIKPN